MNGYSKWVPGRSGTPKCKTLEFDSLIFDYDYGTCTLTARNREGDGFSFGPDELGELRAALRSLGMETSGDKTEYRGRG